MGKLSQVCTDYIMSSETTVQLQWMHKECIHFGLISNNAVFVCLFVCLLLFCFSHFIFHISQDQNLAKGKVVKVKQTGRPVTKTIKQKIISPKKVISGKIKRGRYSLYCVIWNYWTCTTNTLFLNTSMSILVCLPHALCCGFHLSIYFSCFCSRSKTG